MDSNSWLFRSDGSGHAKCQDSYGRLLEMMSQLEEDVDPRLTQEQAEFFKSLITGLIDTIRSFKDDNKR